MSGYPRIPTDTKRIPTKIRSGYPADTLPNASFLVIFLLLTGVPLFTVFRRLGVAGVPLITVFQRIVLLDRFRAWFKTCKITSVREIK